MARQQKGKTPASAGQSQPPDNQDPESISTVDAEAALGVGKRKAMEADVPADAGLIRGDEARDTFRVGNREYSSTPRSLGDRQLNILPDLPDIRDRIYSPHLKALHARIYPTIAFAVRDQGSAQSCTGHALAHVVDFLIHREVMGDAPISPSARMLYEMAKRNDEWAGTAYDGSSIRGALSGFYRNGVCLEDDSDASGDDWILTYDRAKQARDTRLGSYYRVLPDISDYHAALNEIGAIYASAQIHANWQDPTDGRIEPSGVPAGGHAFAIVGYDAEGFWVLNSWGPQWGRGGLAHWRYEDWAATIMDAWVLQLGVHAPTAFSAIPRPALANVSTPAVSTAPNRGDIVGHFINIDDGRYVVGGRYASPTAPEMMETVNRLGMAGSNDGKGYDHLVIYAHGGLNTLDDEANRIATWKRRDIFGRNGIYNFHLMWGSGFIDEAFGPLSTSQAGRATGVLGDLLFEAGPGKALGSAAWRNMKQDAVAAFTESAEYDGGFKGLRPLLGGIDQASRRPVVHLVGHSAGAIVLGCFLAALNRFKLKNVQLGSIHLMAPACTADFFNGRYGPYLAGKGGMKLRDKIYLYNMDEEHELSDTVGIGGGLGYSRSLLYLVSRAYERLPKTPLAGMKIHAGDLVSSNKLSIDYSVSEQTASTSHGGFDNDFRTLSTIMSRVLGHVVPHPPVADELTGY
jgi:hypothetical protein